MVYLLFVAIAVVLFGIAHVYRKKKKHQKKLAFIAGKWAKPTDEVRKPDLIAGYHRYCNKAEDNSLSDAIAADIDLESVFAFADRTNSKPGQQYLYQKLRSTKKDPAFLMEIDQLAELFKLDDSLRAATEFELSQLDDTNAYYLHELFSTEYQALYSSIVSTYIKLAGVLWLMMVAITIINKNPLLFIISLGLTLLNFYLHYSNKRKVANYVYSLPQLHVLMRVAKNISKLVVDAPKDGVESSLQKLNRLKRSLGFVSFQDNVNNDPTDISSAVWDLIKTVLLIEPAMFLASIDMIKQQKANIELLFNYVGKTDMAISLLSLRLSLPRYSKPIFNDDEHQTMAVTGLYHPLIKNCVPNSLQVSSAQGVLITGSNMSGKTTFIRSVAINALLSQTLFTSCTHSYHAPFLQVFTSIRVSDDVEEHKSYFQAEALSVLNIINKSQVKTSNSLIIIDEIFRGTNTIERVAAAKAILAYLTANKHFVFVSTHDLDLAELLGSDYAVYSFEETVADTRLEFDYKIKPGILKNKNGIAILSALGYPQSVIADATAMSELLRQKYKL